MTLIYLVGCSYVELKNGHILDGVGRRMRFWKAEEYQKFAYPASEVVLQGILPERHYHIWTLIARITELIFNCCRSGWTMESINLLEKIVWRHNILTEETEGLQNCTITLHNLLHCINDIVRFFSPDNYWCFVFERAMHKYVTRSSNNKNLECTFAQAEVRREVFKFNHLQITHNNNDLSSLEVCMHAL